MVLTQQSSSLVPFRRKPTHANSVHQKLLSMYIEVIPFIIPKNVEDVCVPTLWHPDLNLGNLFISESGPAELQGIIDWQHTAILPYFNQASMPPAVFYEGSRIDINEFFPDLPSNFDDLPSEEQAACRQELRLANRHRFYEGSVGKNRRRRVIRRLPHRSELMMLPTFVTRACADGVFELREALMMIRRQWDAIAGPGIPCPIDFSAHEIAEHEIQMEKFRCYQAAVRVIYSTLQCEGDGLVRYGNYDAVRPLIDGLEKTWDEDKTGAPFPFKDGEYSYFLS
jgi:hypothetical protein